MHSDHKHMVEGETNRREYFKFALVVLAITAAALVLTFQSPTPSLMEGLRYFMGVFLVTFAGFKLVGYKMFAVMFASYDVIAKRWRLYGYIYPFLELALGLLFLLNLIPTLRNLTTFIVMALAAIGVWGEVRARSGVHCACLGNVIKLPLSTVSLVENTAMAAMALGMLLLG